jgi:hypothetical protein
LRVGQRQFDQSHAADLWISSAEGLDVRLAITPGDFADVQGQECAHLARQRPRSRYFRDERRLISVLNHPRSRQIVFFLGKLRVLMFFP